MGSLPVLVSNKQPTERKRVSSDGSLDVVDIWYTIQGEGPFGGLPAIFIRTAGCNLQCSACDSDYTSGREVLGVEEIVHRVEVLSSLQNRRGLIVLTGGEPFRQGCGKVIRRLIQYGYMVQVETNGTIYDQTIGDEGLWSNKDLVLVCSPKTPFVHPDLKRHIKCLKYVMDSEHVDPSDGLPTDVLGSGLTPCRPWEGFSGEIYLQACDEGVISKESDTKNKENMVAVVESCLKYGYRLSIQLHKLVGVP